MRWHDKWYSRILSILNAAAYIVLLSIAMLAICLVFYALYPNFKSESIFDLVFGIISGIISSWVFSVILVNRFEKKRQNWQFIIDWVRHLEELENDLREYLINSKTHADSQSRAFIEEAKIIADYAEQTEEIIKRSGVRLSDIALDALCEIKDESKTLCDVAQGLLLAPTYINCKNDLVMPLLGSIHINIVKISASFIGHR